MYHLRSFHLRDMTACGAALRRLGAGGANLEAVADGLVRYLYESFTLAKTGESACVLVRLFTTTPYCRLTPDLQALVAKRLGKIPEHPSLTCMTLLASAGTVAEWNDPSRSSRFRVIPLGSPEEVDRLPMFSQLFRQLGVSLPLLAQSEHHLLLDRQEHTFNVFHILQAQGSPYVPAQEEFVLKHGIRSVLGFGAPLPNGELFSVILFSKDVIPETTAQLFKPLALCAQIALAPHVDMAPLSPAATKALSVTNGTSTDKTAIGQLNTRIAELEKLLTVHEQTVDAQANRIEMIVSGADMGTWEWDIPSGHLAFNHRWASMLGYQIEELDPHVRTWEQLVHPDDKAAVMGAIAAHLRGDTPLYSSEHRLQSKTGVWQWVLNSGRVLARDAAGAPLRAAGIHLDISARKALEEAETRAQQDLREKQRALDEAQTLAHLGSWEWNIVTGAERWSDEQYRIFGLDPARTTADYDLFRAALHP
ncbi:MAG: PAS domain-containing protein, partial [Nitrospirota bacterium]|nr:PAS domain-containing protein [Nitrospirota bacterium]